MQEYNTVACLYQLLETMSYKSKPEDYTLGAQPENKEKNRNPDILPGFPYRFFYITVLLIILIMVVIVDCVKVIKFGS